MLAAAVILIILLLVAAYYKNERSRSEHLMIRVTPEHACDLQKSACSLETPNGGRVTLNITPKPIPLVQELTIEVQIASMQAQQVAIKFNGTDMDMGPNNVTLQAQEQGVFTGNGLLPVCIRNRMQWQAEVYVQTERGIIIAPFIFATQKTY